MKIAVVGAGIAGITTAYYAARAGADVEVFDSEPHPAMRTSYANGGQVSVSNSEVWTTWSNVRKGIKWMFRKDAPLLIRPGLDWHRAKWLSQFLYHTARGDYYANTMETIRMGLASRRLYADIVKDQQLEFDQSASGILHFYKDSQYFEHAKQVQVLYDQAGCEWTLLDQQGVRERDPALSNLQGIVGGAWTGADWTGDIHKFCYALANNLRGRPNVRFYFDDTVTDLREFSKEYDAVVVCAGVGSRALAQSVGDQLPIYPVKGYSITITAPDIKSYEAMPKVSLLDDEAKIVTSTLGNRFRVAGTAELAGENYDIRRDRIEPLLQWVRTNFPQINTHDYSSWACLRPMTPNMMPIFRSSTRQMGVYYNTGHGHLGWTLAPYTAKQIVDIIIKGE